MHLRVLACTGNGWTTPLAELRLAGPARAAGIDLIQLPPWEEASQEQLAAADLVVVQREYAACSYYPALVQRARLLGRPLVFEIDDLLIDLPLDHPDHAHYAALQSIILSAVREADAVSVSTPALAQVLHKENPNIWVLPNCLDDQTWRVQPVSIRKSTSQENTSLVIGCMGSESHAPDIAAIVPALQQLLERYTFLELHFWGVRPPPELARSSRVVWSPPVTGDYTDFARQFQDENGPSGRWDIAIAPLNDSTFNRCKSSIKYLEYSASGIAGVYADLPPYHNAVRHGETGLLAQNTVESWTACLEQLIKTPDLRYRLAQNALNDVLQNGLLVRHAWKWANTYTRILRREKPDLQSFEGIFEQSSPQYSAKEQGSIVPEKPDASLVILTYNNLDYTRQCLESIYKHTPVSESSPTPYELIVVDNASTDGTPAFLRAYAEKYPNLNVILNRTNEGFAKGNNQGAAAARGKFLVFLNNDIVVTPGWLPGLLKHLDNPTIGMAGPVTNASGNETRIPVTYQDISGLEAFSAEYTHTHAGENFEIAMLPFQCVALRRAVWDEVGPLDEGFGIGMFEDDDYALRLHHAGYKILCAEDVFIHHWGSVSFSKLGVSGYWQLFQRNRVYFEQKWQVKWQPHLPRPELFSEQYRQTVENTIYFGGVIARTEQALSESQQAQNEVGERLAKSADVQNKLYQDLLASQETLSEFRNLLAGSGAKLAVAEGKLAAVEEKLTAAEGKLAAAEGILEEQKQRNQELNHLVYWYLYQLQTLQQSRTYRIALIFQKIRKFFIPEKSRQERLILFCLQLVRILFHQGLVNFLRVGIVTAFRHWPLRLAANWFGNNLPLPWKRSEEVFSQHNLYPDRTEVVLFAPPDLLPDYQPRRAIETESSDNQVRVSLISTLRNEAKTVKAWLESILLQSRLPDEIVITDGGSTDGTQAIIREMIGSFPIPIKFSEAPAANISRGRNLAIQQAAGPLIACSDCGSVLDKDWLKTLLVPFETDPTIEASMGYSLPLGSEEIDALCSSYFMADLSLINPATFLPSGRSLVMKKEVWERVDGYPEWLSDAGEDTLFDVMAKVKPARWAFCPKAIVRWKAPHSLRRFYRTVFRYSKGDGEGALFTPHYQNRRAGVYWFYGVWSLLIVASLICLAILSTPWKLLIPLAILAHAAWQYWSHIWAAAKRLKIGLRTAALDPFYLAAFQMAQLRGFSAGVRGRTAAVQRSLARFTSQLQDVLAAHPQRRGVIIYPATHDWGFMFQRPHQMARAFARQGFLFFYGTNNEKTDGLFGFHPVEPNLYLFHAPLDVFKDLKSPIVYIGSPWHADKPGLFTDPRIIYDHYDDLNVSSGRKEDHQKLIHSAQVVLVTSRLLEQTVSKERPDAIFAPNGVDLEFILNCRPQKDDPPPADWLPIEAAGKPVVGYSGALAEWFDYELLSLAARQHPQWQFVLIGVNYDGSLDRSGILQLPNVAWLGLKPYAELFKYVWRFDIATIPFKINEITLATSPIKQFEYMACLKPVVATPMPECRNYPEILIGETPDHFSACLETAIELTKDSRYLDNLAKTAMANTWSGRVSEIIQALESRTSGQRELHELRDTK